MEVGPQLEDGSFRTSSAGRGDKEVKSRDNREVDAAGTQALTQPFYEVGEESFVIILPLPWH